MLKKITVAELLTRHDEGNSPYALYDNAHNINVISGEIYKSFDPNDEIAIEIEMGTLHREPEEIVQIAESIEDIPGAAVTHQVIPTDENGFFLDEAALDVFEGQTRTPIVPMVHRHQLPSGDRTLTYGYDVDRMTIHVYTYGDQIVMHRFKGGMLPKTLEVVTGESLAADTLRPNKRVYPARTNPDFARLMYQLDRGLTMTTFEKRSTLPELIDPAELHRAIIQADPRP